MSYVPLSVIVVIGLLTSLACYAFIAHRSAYKKEQHIRLVTGLKARTRNIKNMLGGFPEGFLPNNILALAQKQLVEISQQLMKLEPEQKTHLHTFQTSSAELSEAQRESKPRPYSSLQSPRQIAEVKACLEELHKFIYRQEKHKNLSRQTADSHREHIKLLLVQVSIDASMIQARNSEQCGNKKLTLHHLENALKIIVDGGKANKLANRAKTIREKISATKQEIKQEAPKPSQQPETPSNEDKETKKEWDKFDKAEEAWKKKNVYD